MSIRNRVLVKVLASLVLVAGLLLALGTTNASWSEASRRVEDAHAQLEMLMRLERDASDVYVQVERVTRGEGDASALAEVARSARDGMQELHEALVAEAEDLDEADDREQQQEFQRLEDLRASFDRMIAVRAGSPDLEYRAIQVLLSAAVEREQQEVRAAQAAALATGTRASDWAWFVGVAALVSAFALGAWLLRSIASPIAELESGTRALAGGDLAHRIPVKGRDELARLAASFNAMAAELETQRAGLAEKSLLEAEVEVRRKTEHELEVARDAAEAANRSKSQFLANMSHEIRTPMNGIIGMTTLLLDSTLTNEQAEYANTIRGCSESLLSIVNDILDFSKIEAGKLELEVLDFDLRQGVEEVLDVLAERAQRKGLELLLDVAADVPRDLRGDPGRVRQVLLNLIGNAVKFTERGEVVVKVRKVESDGERDTIRVEVRDTGIGISEEACERLFGTFVQADASMTRKYGGTGLGLAISKRLAELMGGSIGVESVPGKGSTFWFTIRVERQAERSSPTEFHVRMLHGRRALIVDDNATNLAILRELLRSWGIASEEALNGVDALSVARAALRAGRGFDLAIIDVQMPKMHGFELAKAMRDDPALARIPIVVLTSLVQRMDAEALARAGVEAYLAKPVRRGRLAQCLIQILGEHAPKPNAPLPAASEPSGPKPRALVVEDNPVNQIVATRLLSKCGWRADVAGNGVEAVRAAQSIRYDLILMDCQMPEMNGWDATRAIREKEHGTDRHVPIVALTAAAMKGDMETCLEAGMDDYLSKPIALDDLRRVLALHGAKRDGAARTDAA